LPAENVRGAMIVSGVDSIGMSYRGTTLAGIDELEIRWRAFLFRLEMASFYYFQSVTGDLK